MPWIHHVTVADAFVAPMMPAPSAFAGNANINTAGSGSGAGVVRPAGVVPTMVATPDRVVTSSSAFEPTEGPNAPLRVNNNGEV